MKAPNANFVVGVFDHLPQAEQAIQELWLADFSQDHIDMVTRSEGKTKATPRSEWEKKAANGAVAGSVAGATAGVVAGTLALVLIPGIGVVLGGGLLLGALGGAALGAAGGTFLGPFVALHMTSDEANYYASEVDQGRTVVLVQPAGRAVEAAAILDKNGARQRQAAVAGYAVSVAVLE
jgi:hypothetical protein